MIVYFFTGLGTNMNFYFIVSYLFYPFHWVFPFPCPPNQVGERKERGDRGYDNIVCLSCALRMTFMMTFHLVGHLRCCRRWCDSPNPISRVMLCISEIYLRNFGSKSDNLGCQSNIFSWNEGRVMMSFFNKKDSLSWFHRVFYACVFSDIT
jgi:hypothetical protein